MSLFRRTSRFRLETRAAIPQVGPCRVGGGGCISRAHVQCVLEMLSTTSS